MRKFLEHLLITLAILLFLYFWAACVTFQFRNPRANVLQVFVHIVDVLTFEKLEKFQ